MPVSSIPVNESALKNWQNDRFGMFIHWGPVSLTGHFYDLKQYPNHELSDRILVMLDGSQKTHSVK